MRPGRVGQRRVAPRARIDGRGCPRIGGRDDDRGQSRVVGGEDRASIRVGELVDLLAVRVERQRAQSRGEGAEVKVELAGVLGRRDREVLRLEQVRNLRQVVRERGVYRRVAVEPCAREVAGGGGGIGHRVVERVRDDAGLAWVGRLGGAVPARGDPVHRGECVLVEVAKGGLLDAEPDGVGVTGKLAVGDRRRFLEEGDVDRELVGRVVADRDGGVGAGVGAGAGRGRGAGGKREG